jgi:uncharacterized protein
MKKSALILHAWLNGPNAHWYPWLKTELETRGYTVYLPEIPTMETSTPNFDIQKSFIEKNFPPHEHSIVIGHSLGTLLALRLAEKYPMQKMFLVAGWDFDDLTPEHQSFWKNKIDHEKIKRNVKEIYCLTSDNDPYITAFTVEEMSKRLGATYILIPAAGHFTKKYGITKIPQLLPYL